jgi:hypothetical protein
MITNKWAILFLPALLFYFKPIVLIPNLHNAEINYICSQYCSRSSTDRIMVSGTIDMSSNLVGSTNTKAIYLCKWLCYL